MLDLIVKKLKDIVYDINDIIVVMAILACAVLLIMNRVETIVAYPTSGDPDVLVAEKVTPGKQPGQSDEPSWLTTGSGLVLDYVNDMRNDGNAQEDATSDDGQADNPQVPDQDGDQTGIEQNTGDTPVETPGSGEYPYSMYVAYGETAGQIAQKLLDAGIIDDKNEFYDALGALKAERKLLAGSFIIPKNSTPTDIVRILTGG